MMGFFYPYYFIGVIAMKMFKVKAALTVNNQSLVEIIFTKGIAFYKGCV